MNRSRPVPHGLMFHHFHGTAGPRGGLHPRGQGAISGDALDRLIRFVGRDNILCAKDWIERMTAGTLEPRHKCLTFDDNLKCQYEIALPVMKHHDLTAFWFIYTSVYEGIFEKLEAFRHFRTIQFGDVDDFYAAFFRTVDRSPFGEETATALVGFEPSAYNAEYTFYSDADRAFRYIRDRVLGPARYDRIMERMIEESSFDVERDCRDLWMDPAQLRELHAGGHVIGLHSHTHPMKLAELDPDTQRSEYARNRTALIEILGVAPTVMSHPCGSYDGNTLKMLREMGIVLGFRANMPLATGYSDLEQPREDQATIFERMEQARS